MIEVRLYCEAAKKAIESYLEDPADDHLITAKAVLEQALSALPPGVSKPDYMTDDQFNSVKKLYMRDPNYFEDFNTFVKKFEVYGGYIGRPWKGMFVGIEPDGYTHT